MTGRPASTARTLRIATVARRRLAEASLLGAAAIGASIALMGTSAWLISRAAQHPSEASLTLAIVGVQFFGLSRGFFRYGERLVGHDAALGLLADLRVRVYERLEALAPAGLPAFRRGDLVARMVDDVDSLQDVVLRVLQPFAVAVLVGTGTVVAMWWFLPQAGLVLLVALGDLSDGGAVADGTSRHSGRGEAGNGAGRAHRRRRRPDRRCARTRRDGWDLRPADADCRSRRGAARHRPAVAPARRGSGSRLTTALAGLASWGALTLGVRAVEAAP